jgi:hypothetical protein
MILAVYSESWRAEYAGQRYLQYLFPHELSQPYVDLLTNVLGFNQAGQPQFLGFDLPTASPPTGYDGSASPRKLGRELPPRWRRSRSGLPLER